jgi:hypothetical protein
MGTCRGQCGGSMRRRSSLEPSPRSTGEGQVRNGRASHPRTDKTEIATATEPNKARAHGRIRHSSLTPNCRPPSFPPYFLPATIPPSPPSPCSSAPGARLYRPDPKSLLGRSALESLFTPEEACLLDAALVGQARLAEAHVTRLSSAEGLDKAMEGLKGSAVSNTGGTG